MSVGTEPLLPSYVQRLEVGLECLGELDLPPDRAVTILTMLWTYARGDAEQAVHLCAAVKERSLAEIGRLLAARLRALGDECAPRVLAALDGIDGAVGEDEFEAAIDVVLDGLERQ